MALVNCPECEKQISSAAANCPHCGIPIAAAADTAATGTSLTTIQETAKRFKIQLLGAWGLLFIGLTMLFVDVKAAAAGSDASGYAGFPIMAAVCWWVVTKFRIWWHHR